MTETKCIAKHTMYQPTDEEWKCPKCGSGDEHFDIQEPAEFSSDDCVQLHVNDELSCYNCGYGISGKEFASRLQKQKNLVTCPCCKGSGLVPKD